MRKKSLSLVSVVCLPLLACGSSDNNSKTIKLPDAKTFLDAGSGSAGGCKAPASYSKNLGSGQQVYAKDVPATGSADHFQEVQGTLAFTGSGTGSNDTVDVLTIYMDQGSGTTEFAAGIKAGTYNVDPTTDNSLEILLWPALPGNTTTIPAAYLASEQYLAVAGTLTLTAEGGVGSAITGSLSGLDMIHVDLANNQFTSADDDGSGNPCESTLASSTFSTTLQAQAFQGQVIPITGGGSHILVGRHH